MSKKQIITLSVAIVGIIILVTLDNPFSNFVAAAMIGYGVGVLLFNRKLK